MDIPKISTIISKCTVRVPHAGEGVGKEFYDFAHSHC